MTGRSPMGLVDRYRTSHNFYGVFFDIWFKRGRISMKTGKNKMMDDQNSKIIRALIRRPVK